MIPDLGRVVEQAPVGGRDDLLQVAVILTGVGGQSVEVGDVRGVMLAVVVLESLLGQIGIQGTLVIGKIGQCERHVVGLLVTHLHLTGSYPEATLLQTSRPFSDAQALLPQERLHRSERRGSTRSANS